MFKKLYNKLLDYVAYVVLVLLGLGIFHTLYMVWFTEAGRAFMILCVFVAGITWSIIRVLRKS